ncbi:degenerin unc-8-like [Uloborus diversus]|uniref:degenerin unc-8-like n=1 Tax=Uloborus diversus TaxID=327109 RepID=UPI002409218F|nr:degenerin unc-8-like [Uloborus diversus]
MRRSVLLGLSILCIRDMYFFLSAYFSYPVLTNLEIHTRTSMEFPAVTLCNLNRMHNMFYKCIQKQETWEQCIVMMRSIVTSERKIQALCLKKPTAREKKLCLRRLDFFQLYTGRSPEFRQKIGYKFNHVILHCLFKGNPCGVDNFTFHQSLQYGNCYSFNYMNDNIKIPQEVDGVGPNNALELVLDARESTYLGITPSVGMRVIIHNVYEKPNPVENGINISPGFETRMSLSKMSIQRLPPPYKDRCFDYNSRNREISSRSRYDCVRSCVQKKSLSKCGCTDPFLGYDSSNRSCHLRNEVEMQCLDDILVEMGQVSPPCECPLPCFVNLYKNDISRINYKHMKEDGLAKLISDTFNLKKKSTLLPLYRRNATLKIFYRTLDHKVFTQYPALRGTEVYGSLGAILSLWLDFSLFSIIQHIQIILVTLRLMK